MGGLDPFRAFHSSIAAHVAGVEGSCGLEQQHVSLIFRHRTVFDSAGDDEEFACLQPYDTVSKIHPEAAADDEKEFIFAFMVMPDEFALELDELHHLTVEFAGDRGLPGIRNACEGLAQIHLFHVASLAFKGVERS